MKTNDRRTQCEIHDLLSKRWSPRAFDRRAIDAKDVRALLQAARWAPSCFNEQPWRFILARRQERDAFDKLLGCLLEGNRVWAQNASLLLLSFASTRFAKSGKENRHAWHDVGLAVAQMTLQATAMGLFVHQMAGIDRNRIQQEFQLPDDVQAVSGIAIGGLGDANALSEELRSRELEHSGRMDVSQFAFDGDWGLAFQT